MSRAVRVAHTTTPRARSPRAWWHGGRFLPRWIGLAVVGLGIAPNAGASDEPDAAAMALFREGRQLVSEGKWEPGCERIAESFQRYAAASTLLNLARCDEHFGRVATAWSRYQRAAGLAPTEARPRLDLVPIAEEGMTRLAPRVPYVRVDVTPEPDGLRVRISGKEFPRRHELPMDPGSYEAEIGAPGFQRELRKLEVHEGEHVTLSITLQPEQSVPVVLPETKAPAPAPKPGRNLAGPLVLGGASVLAAGAFGYFWFSAVDDAKTLRDTCAPRCSQADTSDIDRQILYSHIALGVAGASAAGALLWLLLDKGHAEPNVSVAVGQDGFGGTLHHAF